MRIQILFDQKTWGMLVLNGSQWLLGYFLWAHFQCMCSVLPRLEGEGWQCLCEIQGVKLYYLLCSRQPTDGAPFIFWQQGYNFLFHSRISMHRLRGPLNLPFSPPDSQTTMAMFILLFLISLIGLRWRMLANKVDVRGSLTAMYPCKAILVRLSSFVSFSLR